MLELGRHVARDIAIAFKRQVLRAVQNGERVAHDLLLAAEVVRIALVIRGQIMTRAAVTEQHWLIDTNRFALHLHAEVGVGCVDEPDAGVVRFSVHRGLVESRDGRVIALALGRGAEHERLAEGVRVGLDADFLPVADDVVRAEHVSLLNANDFEDGTIGWAGALVCRGCAHVALVRPWQLVISVHGEPALSQLILEHEAVAGANATVSRVRPRHLLVGSLMYCRCLIERKLSIGHLCLVVRLSAFKYFAIGKYKWDVSKTTRLAMF